MNYLRISNLHGLYKPTFSPKVFTPAQKRSSQTHPNPSLSPKKTRRRGQVLHWNDLHHWTHHQLHQHLGAKSHQCHSVEAAYAWAGWAGLGSVRGKCILYIYIYIYDYISRGYRSARCFYCKPRAPDGSHFWVSQKCHLSYQLRMYLVKLKMNAEAGWGHKFLGDDQRQQIRDHRHRGAFLEWTFQVISRRFRCPETDQIGCHSAA